MKDNFSKQADLYAQYRPAYPPEMFEFLLSVVLGRERAWDCGTGNGQIAQVLAEHFQRIDATDISESQIRNAVQKANIVYRVERGEEASFPGSHFDLITVAQALHWFDFDKFYFQVNRTLKPNGVFAAIGYSLVRADEGINKLLDDYDRRIIRPYWDPERRYIDEEYRTIPFPFDEIPAPRFESVAEWDFEHMAGFLNSWSAAQHYMKKHHASPVDLIVDDLRRAWGVGKKKIRFPMFVRVGKHAK